MENLLKRFIERRLAELALSPFEAAKRAGLERGFINDILQGKKASIRGANIGKLARALDVSPRTLVESTASSGAPVELLDWIEDNSNTLNDGPVDSIEDLNRAFPGKKIVEMLPVFNLIKVRNGDTIIEPRPSGFLPKDKLAEHARIDYVVVAYDDAMEPEIQPGERIFIDRNYPPVRGNTYLFIENSDKVEFERVVFGKLTEISDEEWRVQQWHPFKELKLSRDEWPKCHRVAGKLTR